jgi:hypothetical protein
LLGFMCNIFHPDIDLGNQRLHYAPSMNLSTFPAHDATLPM